MASVGILCAYFVCGNLRGIADYVFTNINNDYYVHIMVNFKYIKGRYAFTEGKMLIMIYWLLTMIMIQRCLRMQILNIA